AGQVLVDGLGVGDVGNIVLRDRQQLSKDGILIVVLIIDKESGKLIGGPDLISRGFVYVRESESLIDEAREVAKESIKELPRNGSNGWNAIKNDVRDALQRHFQEKMKRRPVVLPVVMEV